MIKSLSLLLIVALHIDADIYLKDIESKPQSRAKNFMIWQYLKQDITPSQADTAYANVEGKNNKILKLYLKKSSNKEIEYRQDCRKNKKLLSIKDKECLDIAFSTYKTLALSKKQRKNLAKKLDSKEKKDMLSIQNESYKQKSYLKYDANTILTLFVNTTTSHRRKHLNIHLNDEFINSISSSWKISQFIKLVVHDPKLNRLQLALLNLDGEKLNSLSNFYLALNHLKHKSVKEAIKYFKLSRSKAKQKIDIDKNNFWIYQVSKDKNYIDKLLKSDDINIYSIFAYEKRKKDFKNYFVTLKTEKGRAKDNINDPFVWQEISKKIKDTPKEELLKLSKNYMHRDMIAVLSLIVTKAHDYSKHAYIMPYTNYLSGITADEKALVYAIMKQESQFIPSALSRSFALGLMQIMPFVTDDLSKKVDNPIMSYNDMFIPEYNLAYALEHLKWMRTSLYHPLFMAYAYNGGMGFLRRHLQKGHFSDGEYEPFMSMELMANSESREYGKKVLANYVIYKKILGESISIVELFERLKHPKMTDRFREQD